VYQQVWQDELMKCQTQQHVSVQYVSSCSTVVCGYMQVAFVLLLRLKETFSADCLLLLLPAADCSNQ
jgi:hypothetical protein